MTTETAARPEAGPAHHPRHTARAAVKAAERNALHVDLPVLGRVELPPRDDLAFMGGIVTLAAVGIIEWPIAVVLTTGHLLAHNRHVRLLRDFGKALEEA